MRVIELRNIIGKDIEDLSTKASLEISPSQSPEARLLPPSGELLCLGRIAAAERSDHICRLSETGYHPHRIER